VRFGVLLGRAIEAQAAIAVLNTLLTLIGLLLLRIPLTAMLSVVVFVCSFVPVLGVLISTTPIVLVALNAGGFGLSLAAIGLVVIVHAVEAYLLNPLIYGKHLKLNPVLTLIILYVGYHAFGFWGLLLGVPLARYFIHDVLGVPYRDRGTPKRGVTAPAPVE
jgi:predicted PurR-regulated permease PerM